MVPVDMNLADPAQAALQAVEPATRRGGLGMGGLVNERWAGRMP